MSCCCSEVGLWSLHRSHSPAVVHAAMLIPAVGFFCMSNVWHYSQARAGLAIAPSPPMVIPPAIVTGLLEW
jgi:hypothetical protein